MSRAQAAVGWLLVALVGVLLVGRPSGMTQADWGLFSLVLVWTMVPPFVASVLARRAGGNRARAIALGFLFGWIGVLIVYWMNRRRTTATS